MPKIPPSQRKTPLRVAFGAEIQFRRQQMGISQRDLAACAGITHEWLCSIEAGRGGIKVERLIDLADCLCVKPPDLIPASYQRVVWERE